MEIIRRPLIKQDSEPNTLLAELFGCVAVSGSSSLQRVVDAGIHLYRTCMSGSVESVRWNACVHRLDLSLYSHPKEFWSSGVRTYDNSKGKIPTTVDSEEG